MRNFYLGIWYNNIPERTYVWVANRDNPITTASSSALAITNSSGMVLSDSKGHTVWTTTSNITTGGDGSYAVLLNSGNLVLRLPNATNIWQSFDHPTNTILPTMRFLMSYKAQVVAPLVAWKSLDDPSSGDFSWSADPSSLALQLVTWNKTKPYCRIGVLEGVSVSGGTYLSNISSILYQAAIKLGDEFYYMFTISDGSPFTRIKLEYTGRLRHLSWNKDSSSWTLMSENPVAACDIYASCGPFGYCDFTESTPTCKCLDGFEPAAAGLDFSRGCQRRVALKCSKQSHFMAVPGMKVPDKFMHI